MINMDKNKQDDLGAFLHKNSSKSNQEIAESIRKAKKLSNSHTNVVIFQEKKSICSTAEKLLRSVKCFDENAELIIKTKKGQWKKD